MRLAFGDPSPNLLPNLVTELLVLSPNLHRALNFTSTYISFQW